MTVVIKIVCSATGDRTAHDGHYVQEYVPNFDRHGYLVSTSRLESAKRYRDHAAAFEAWRAINGQHPVRDDGKPNRPLTAFTVQMESVP